MLSFLILFLHIATMFTAVTVGFGFSLFLVLAERTGQAAAVRGVGFAGRPTGVLTPVLFVLGGLFGLLTAISFHYNLLAPWLVIAYIGWTVAMLTGVLLHRPFGLRLGALLPTVPDGPIAGPLAEVLADPRERLAIVIDVIVLATLIFDMVVKPFS